MLVNKLLDNIGLVNNLRLKKDILNKYRLIDYGKDSLTAYYFSCPIISNDNSIITTGICEDNGIYYSDGINVKVEYHDNHIKLKNEKETITLKFKRQDRFINTTEKFFGVEMDCIKMSDIKIFPSLNGVAFELNNVANYELALQSSVAICNVNANNTGIAFINDNNSPILNINTLVATDSLSNVFPVLIDYRIQDSKNFTLKFNTKSNLVNSIFFEINFYASKMIFDTTIESRDKNKNNAYGSMSFLGNSDIFGEQWLYSRINPNLLMDLSFLSVEQATMFLPTYSEYHNNIEIYKLNTDWCSFNSNWNEKSTPDKFLNIARCEKQYLQCDITEIIKDILRLKKTSNPGIVFKPRNHNELLFTAVSTADSYIKPQILKIKLINS